MTRFFLNKNYSKAFMKKGVSKENNIEICMQWILFSWFKVVCKPVQF